jgi:hypothetical protein
VFYSDCSARETGKVVVVARKANEVIYWEDVEEGFGVFALGPEGNILEHDCNQNSLGLALNNWIERGSGKPEIVDSESQSNS